MGNDEIRLFMSRKQDKEVFIWKQLEFSGSKHKNIN